MERETNRKKTRYNNSPEQKKDYICLAMAVIASTEKKKKNWTEILLPFTELDWYNEYKE